MGTIEIENSPLQHLLRPEQEISFLDDIPGCKLPARSMAIKVHRLIKVMNVSILEPKDIGNCSNSGVSSRHDSLALVLDPAEAHKFGDDAVILLYWNLMGMELVRAITLGTLRREHHVMAGGSFIYSSDSRFPFYFPVPLHDRHEM